MVTAVGVGVATLIMATEATGDTIPGVIPTTDTITIITATIILVAIGIQLDRLIHLYDLRRATDTIQESAPVLG